MNGKIKNFYDLEVWKQAHRLSLEIYKLTKNFPRDELFGITSQLRRAATSVSANIAEGFARFHFNDKIRFYYQARGSAAEVQNFTIFAQDIGLIDSDVCKKIMMEAEEIGRLINGLIRSIENQK